MIEKRHKLIIGGTGRAGTTVLVRLLTECGLDTGFTHRSWKSDFFEHCQAGLERDIGEPDSPYVIKSPRLCETLPAVLASGEFVIDHAIVPIRDLESASLSRIRVGGANESVPGGLWNTDDPSRQRAVLGELFHAFMHTLAVNDIPFTLLAFPRFVNDAGYTYEKLKFLVGHIPRERFDEIFRSVADPKLVHTFAAGAFQPPPSAGPPPARVYADSLRRRRRRQRIRRHWQRAAAVAGTALLMFAGAMWYRAHALLQAQASPVAPPPQAALLDR